MTGSDPMTAVLAFAFFGALSGFAYLHLLARSVRALTGRSHGILAATAPLGRALLMAGTFVFSVLHGGTALIAALAGFLLTRLILLRRPGLFVP